MDITEAVLNGDLNDLPSNLWNAEGNHPVDTKVLSSGSMVERSGERCIFEKSGKDIKWSVLAVLEVSYKSDQELTYYCHKNPKEKGVSILEVSHGCDTPCLVSSGQLSGCVYAWFLVGDRIIFLHAGNEGKSDSAGTATKKLAKREMADIFNGLKFALGDKRDSLQELEIKSLLDRLNNMQEIQCGQIIFPSKKSEKRSKGKIAYMSYRIDEGLTGGCYCSITPQNQTKISGMLLEVEGLTENRIDSLLMKVDPDASTSKCCVLI